MLYFLLVPLLTSLLAGTLLTVLYYLCFFLKSFVQNHFISTISLDSSDLTFQWVLDYLLIKGYISRGMSNFTCKIRRSAKSGPIWESSKDFNKDQEKPKIIYTPGIGYHSFVYKGLRIYFTHVVIDRLTVGFERKPMTVESIKLLAYGFGHVEKMKELCEEAVKFAMIQDKDQTNIYAISEYLNVWEKVQSKRHRPIETVILDCNITEEVMNDISNFKQNNKWYVDRGVINLL